MNPQGDPGSVQVDHAGSTGDTSPGSTRPDPERLPQISPWVLAWFRRYTRGYLKRNMHAVRLAGEGPPPIDPQRPLILYMNHPSWWDPLVAIFLSERYFSDRDHFGPIEAKALGRYRFFEKLGLFGIDLDTTKGAARFLRLSQQVMRRPSSALWLTPQGRFADPRERPLAFRPGLAHIARRTPQAIVLPIAIEYPFWAERTPELLIAFGQLVDAQTLNGQDAHAGQRLLEDRLAQTMDRLADLAVRHRASDFQTLLTGKAGVGGIYDQYRRLRARLAGQSFRAEHGEH